MDIMKDAHIRLIDTRALDVLTHIRTKCAAVECMNRSAYMARYTTVSLDGHESTVRNMLCEVHAKYFCAVNNLDFSTIEGGAA